MNIYESIHANADTTLHEPGNHERTFAATGGGPDDTRSTSAPSEARGPHDDQEPLHRGAVVAAIIATFVLIVSTAFVLFGSGAAFTSGTDTPTPSTVVPEPSTDASVPPIDGSVPGADPFVAPPVPNQPLAPVPPVPPAITVPTLDPTPPAVPPVAPPPVAPPVVPPPPIQPPVPVGVLSVQAGYELDPGVDALSIALSNQGDLALTYVIVNDGEGFTADQPTGDLEPGDSVDVWIDLDLVADGDGPTLFEQVVDIQSNGGDAVVTVSGQVEKPGFVIADFETLPLVDYRATLRFTNVGGLPVEIVGLDAPGLRYAPIPDVIAAGETYELDVAVCEGGASLSIVIPHPQPFPNPPTFTIGSTVVLETLADPAGEPTAAATTVLGDVDVIDPLDCSPVIAIPTVDLTIQLD